MLTLGCPNSQVKARHEAGPVLLSVLCFDGMSPGLVSSQMSPRRTHEYAIICRSLKANQPCPSMSSGSMPFSNGDVVAVLIFTVTSKDKCGYF